MVHLSMDQTEIRHNDLSPFPIGWVRTKLREIVDEIEKANLWLWKTALANAIIHYRSRPDQRGNYKVGLIS